MERRILKGPRARAALLRGMDRMTSLLRPTLGPLPRTVAIARLVGHEPPEILDSAATIARRTIQLADPYEDMGGMLIRHLVWRVFDREGDGGATAAVLTQSLVHAGVGYIAAGGNPVMLRRGMERGLGMAAAALRRQARPIDGPTMIAGVVAGSLGSIDLADMIGEVVDAAGPDGAIMVEDAQGTQTVLEYIDGVRWNEGYVSAFLLQKDEGGTTRVLNPRVLVTDHSLDRAEDLLPTLEACVAAGERNLLVVAPEIRDSAVGLLVVNRERGVLDGAVAVRAPSFGLQRTRILEDIAVMTGGRCVCQDRQDRLADVTIDDLGKARQAWATKVAFGILGGQGSKMGIRQRIAEARAELGSVEDDPYTSEKIKERIGKLAGTAAIIRVGAPSKSEQEDVKLRIQAAVTSARAALREGVVPGGGAALLACISDLTAIEASAEGDEKVGIRALAHALAEPMRVILGNAGLEVAPIVHEARRRAVDDVPDCVFDVLRQAWVHGWNGGIVDPLTVTLAALETSIGAAGLVLTSEVLVRRKDPPMSMNP
ncbi:MAG: chaperonin GroEL [Chloroflexota bacterium]|nr:chaperonin GroEL [Chloroflexota bacterium]